MSREVRRVLIGWQHPVEHNPHWLFQRSTPYGMSKPESLLHGPTEQFVSLSDDYPGAVASWEKDLQDVRDRTGFNWEWHVEYNLTGYRAAGESATEPVVYPWDLDGDTQVTVRDEDHLSELLIARIEGQRPDPTNYMPVWDVPADELGWCLYQTVSEGTPVTPVFATADELIDHLCTVGQDWDQRPMRRKAAETLVRNGSSLGSFIVAGGQLLDSSKDADLVEQRLGGAS